MSQVMLRRCLIIAPILLCTYVLPSQTTSQENQPNSTTAVKWKRITNIHGWSIDYRERYVNRILQEHLGKRSVSLR
jgi:hypothetical protein